MASPEITALPPEIRLLFFCLSVRQDEESQREADELLQSDLDWRALLDTALNQSVGSLLYYNLQAKGIQPPQADLMAQLKKTYFHTAGRNTLYRAGLKEILEAFGEANIGVIVLKGAALNESIYPNPALRSMTDVDLLVRETDLQGAYETLQEIGYVQRHSISLEALKKEFHALRYPFEKSSRPLVDLHWTIEASHRSVVVDPVELWMRAEPAIIAGVPSLILAPEDFLLHLCLHLSYHHKFAVAGIRSLCDIAHIIQHFGPELDWRQVAQRAVAWRVSHSVYLTLLLSRRLLCAAVPDDTLDSLKPGDFSNILVTASLERLLAGYWNREGELSYNVLAEMWAADRFKDRVAIFLRRVFISPEAIAARYPVSPDSLRAYLWYPAWFAQEGVRLVKYLGRMLSGNKQAQSFIDLNNWLEAG